MDPTFPTLALGALVALALGTLAPRWLQPVAAGVLGSGLFVLALLSATTPMQWQRWLETRYDRTAVDSLHDPAGIIVPGGGLGAFGGGIRHALAPDDRGRTGRISGAAALAVRFPTARIIHVGRETVPPRDVFMRLGIAPERIVVEDRSSTTYENAVNAAELLKPRQDQRWILVTSAAHMPRALATFRSAGFNAVPYPVDYEADPDNAPAASAAEAALSGWKRGRHEILALVGYLASGRITPWHIVW